MLIKNDKPLAVISYDTQTFSILKSLAEWEGNTNILRIEPADFFNNPSTDYQYMNLVIKDFDERKRVSQALDQHNLDRFSYINQEYTVDQSGNRRVTLDCSNIKFGAGCMVYPAVWGYSGTIGKDVIIHSMTKFAENVVIGQGSFISGSVTIAGGCTIGDYCFLGNNLFMIDHISICNDVRLLPGTNLRKSIKEPGTYYNPNTYRVEQINI